MRRDTLVDFFHDLASMRGEFLVYDDGYRAHGYSYAEVSAAARGFATRLAAAGLRKGDTVVFWGENRPEWIACYWGCLLSGIIVVPIDYRAPAEFLWKVRAMVGARVVLVGDDVPRLVVAPAEGRVAEIWPFGDLNWHADGPVPAAAITRDDTIQIIFTSGATAEPKGVVIRHRNVMANLVPVEHEVLKYRKYGRPFFPIRFLNLLPLSHLFGQSMATTIPPLVDGTVVFTRSLNPHDIVALVKKRRISVVVCVPKILDVLREHAVRLDPRAGAPLPAPEHVARRWWRYRRIHRAFGMKFWAFVVGAAPLSPSLEEFWKRLGFAVIQGYGLTETAPIVTLNNPFKTTTGSVGTPIAGVEVKIAPDGEILVRGENVTSGYFAPGGDTARMFEDGWLHTGDIGELDAEGRLFIRGRKKEMIVTPEGLNVFPDDVEAVLNARPGVKDSAVVGVTTGSEERVHAVLVLAPGADADAIVREANATLLDHQRVRGVSVWDRGELPRTDGTKKLKRGQIRQWVETGRAPQAAAPADALAAVLAGFAGARALGGGTTIEELGLSSLERVELMVALEDTFQTRLDESTFAQAKSLDELRALVTAAPRAETAVEPLDFPTWNRSWPVRLVRRVSLATWILPLARLFAHIEPRGLEHVRALDEPVVFAANHQSHFDVPVILAALPGRVRARVAPAMAKEFFAAHFFPAEHTRRAWLTSSLNYYLAACFFNAFPLPQREAGARQTLRYIGELTGDGWSVLIFPEGARHATGAMEAFRGGIGMIGARLDVPIVPVRLDGVDRVLAAGATVPTRGPVRVTFGPPIRLRGDDYGALAKQVEEAVRHL